MLPAINLWTIASMKLIHLYHAVYLVNKLESYHLMKAIQFIYVGSHIMLNIPFVTNEKTKHLYK